jgi:hypothetical protein
MTSYVSCMDSCAVAVAPMARISEGLLYVTLGLIDSGTSAAQHHSPQENVMQQLCMIESNMVGSADELWRLTH